MEAAEARKIADGVADTGHRHDVNTAEIERRIVEQVWLYAAAGHYRAEFDITPFRLSPGKEALLIVTLRGKGYAVRPRIEDGRTILEIGW